MSFRDVLKHRAFRDLWLGQTISQFGDSLYYVTFMFMVKEITGRNDMVGYVGALETLPYLIIGPFAGVLVDRFDRRKLMLISDLVSFGALILLAILMFATQSVPVWALFVTPFCLSVARSFFMPAKNASIPRLVPTDAVGPANSLSAATQSIAPMAGLALSAGILSKLYTTSPLTFMLTAVLLNAVTFAASAVFINRLPKIAPDRDEHQSTPIADLKQGFSYIGRRREILVIVVVSGLICVFVSPFYPIYVATNKEWFDGTPRTLAWFEFSFFSGMILGAWLSSKIKPKFPAVPFVAAHAALGIFVLMMGIFPSFWFYVLWNVLCGVALPFGNVPIQTYLQLTVDDGLRGRVQSALSMVTAGAHPIGYSCAGMLIDSVGLAPMYWIMGLGIAGSALLGLFSRAFRNATLLGSGGSVRTAPTGTISP